MPDVHEPDLARLFDDFATRVGATAPGADLPSVRARARRRRRARLSAIAIASLVVLAVPAGIYVLFGGPIPRGQGFQPGNPGPPSATPPASPTSAGRIEDTDWDHVTLAIPANGTGCAAGIARFGATQPGVAEVAGTRYRIGGGYDREANPVVAYGDVASDGTAEAVLVVSCLTPEGRRNAPSVVLLVGAEPAPHTLGLAFSSEPRQPDQEGQNFVTQLEVQSGGTVIVGVRTFEGMGQCRYQLRWTGAAFTTGTCQP